MDSSRRDATDHEPRDGGRLAAGLAIDGELRGRGDVRVEGLLRGVVELDGVFAVGPQAQVAAPIRASRVEVSGEVSGSIEAGHVVVHSGGWISGDVRAGTLAIDDGATLEGLVEMDVEAPSRGGARRNR